MSNIWKRSKALEKQEQMEHDELLKDHYKKWDKIWKELQDECEQEGHVRGLFQQNSYASSWFYCEKCKILMDMK